MKRFLTSTAVLVSTVAFSLILLSCGQQDSGQNRELIPNPEGNKKDTFISADKPVINKDSCNFEKYLDAPTTSSLAKRLFNGETINLDKDNPLFLLDSLSAQDSQSRPFYFKVITNSYKSADGYYSEGLGLRGKKYVENNTKEFINYFTDNSCFTDTDLKTWTNIVMLELDMADIKKPVPYIDMYVKILNDNCKDCTPGQKTTLLKFTQQLRQQWDEYWKHSGN
jgi:hypothetical protein